jgi:hypothetical protein
VLCDAPIPFPWEPVSCNDVSFHEPAYNCLCDVGVAAWANAAGIVMRKGWNFELPSSSVLRKTGES